MLLLRWLNFKIGIKLAVLLAMLIVAVVLTIQRVSSVAESFPRRQAQSIKQLNQDSHAARSHRW